jgi:hypothetical protein
MDFAAQVAPGDIFVTATVLDTGARYPTGAGLVQHYDKNWSIKAEMKTGRRGLISALCFDSTGALHVLDPQAGRVDHFGPRAMTNLPNYRFGSMIAKADGTYLLGEHMIGGIPGFEGKGRVCHVDRFGSLIREWTVECGGGVSGFLGVTDIALSPDEQTLYHVSETGSYIYAHDLLNDRRYGPLYGHVEPPGMVFGLACLPCGDLVAATGAGALRLDSKGTVLQRYDLPPGQGWAVIVLRGDGVSFWVLDFLAGRVAKVECDTGVVTVVKDLDLPKALAGIAEVPENWPRGA